MEHDRIITFSEVQGKLRPHQLYALNSGRFNIDGTRADEYMCGPHTSFGAARLFAEGFKSDQDKTDCMSMNLGFTRVVAHELALQYPERRLVLPHSHPPMQGWREIDWMMNWSFHIAGISTEAAREWVERFDLDKPIQVEAFNAYNLSRQMRVVQYDRLLANFMEFIKKFSVRVNPVVALNAMPDQRLSLGSDYEGKLADALGIDIRDVVLNQQHPDFEQFVAINGRWMKESDPILRQSIISEQGTSLITLRQRS